MKVRSIVGYSGTPLVKKLGIKEGTSFRCSEGGTAAATIWPTQEIEVQCRNLDFFAEEGIQGFYRCNRRHDPRSSIAPGYVDIKVCAITEVWSGLKLVLRKELR